MSLTMDQPAVAGPSRPSRRHQGDQLADRIVALQRKNASVNAPSRVSSRRAEQDEFDRGSERLVHRTLYDPTRPVMSVTPAISRPDVDRQPQSQPHPRRPPPPPPPASTRKEQVTKKLFNPDVHDPHQFQRAQHPHPHPHLAPPISSESSQSKSLLRRTIPTPRGDRTPEEEADRERERRRRREGSERGSATTSRRKESDGKSRGSRSSEGSESLRDRERGKGKADSGVKAILKDIHNKIRALEAELTDTHKRMAADADYGVVGSVGRNGKTLERRSEEEDARMWMDLIGKHKDLADLHHLFLVRVFDPLVPSTFSQLAVKYNIPSRLWQVSYYLILERLRHAWMTGHPAALDLLTDLVYDAYKFYTDLLEDQALSNFRTAWIEALGDLARYRMAIASHVGESSTSAARRAESPTMEDLGPPVNSGASIGAEVAQSWDVEDKETWRTTARDWYSMGITEKPGEGRLHHHLALLCRDSKGSEPRALHHFAKSLVVTHQYNTSRESLLPLFDTALQSQRSLPEATALDLFVRLHGMLFTRIDLDNFSSVMSRFMERLDEDARLDDVSRKVSISQVDWIIMASVNIAAVLQYGAQSGIIRKALSVEGQERRKAHAVAGDDEEDVDAGEHPDQPSSDDAAPVDNMPEVTPTYLEAIHLTFAMLKFTLKHPTRQQGLHSVLNPYITVVLTFLATLCRQPHVATLIIDRLPWNELTEFVSNVGDIKEETRLLSGPPLPEDWACRGMEWVGRRLYERGFWKAKPAGRGSGAMAQPRSGERFQSEMDVLTAEFDSTVDISEGVVDEVEGTDLTDGPVAVNQRRWKRVVWAIGVMIKHIDGLSVHGAEVVVEGALQRRLTEVERVKKAEEEQEKRRLQARRERERLEEEAELAEALAELGDDEDSRVVRERRPIESTSRKRRPVRKALHAVPGYTMLVLDTNVLLSSLESVARIVESGQWSVIVPLPVVTELDGLSKNQSPLGVSAVKAISYLESKIRTHSLCLKIQTSRGNYLSDLLIRSEHVDFSDPELASRNMDDLILNIATFQLEHFTDRSKILGGVEGTGHGGTKVVLVTFDRNLRLRARARGIDAADEKELKGILGHD